MVEWCGGVHTIQPGGQVASKWQVLDGCRVSRVESSRVVTWRHPRTQSQASLLFHPQTIMATTSLLFFRFLVLVSLASVSLGFAGDKYECNRRDFVVAGSGAAAASIATSTIVSSSSPPPASAAEVETYVKGVATLQAGLSTDEIGPGAALMSPAVRTVPITYQRP